MEKIQHLGRSPVPLNLGKLQSIFLFLQGILNALKMTITNILILLEPYQLCEVPALKALTLMLYGRVLRSF